MFEVPLRSLAGRWRGNRGQQQGYEGRRRQRTPVFCGIYDPTTGDISVSEPCTKGVCEKLDEDTNEVFCKCNKNQAS